MKIKRYLFSLLLILVLFGNNVNAEIYSWGWLNSGPNYGSPDELCGDAGGTPSYPITGPGGWYGCWGVCHGTDRGSCFVRRGDSCPVGKQYNSDLGSCESTDPQIPAPGVTGDPQPDECPNGRNDNTGHCNPESGADMCESVGNPILIATGQKVEFEEDLSINGSILSFKRNYWSSRRNVSNVGLGWQFNWRMYIQKLTYKNQVKLYRDDGTGYIFTPKENGAWEGTVSTNLSLTSLPNNNGWKVITANGNVEIYNNQGQLISYSKNGYPAINFTYNAIGQLITLLEENTNKTLALTYNAKGLITKVVTNGGLSVTFSYDAQNRLVSRVKNAKTKKYHYENTQFPNALTGITDERNMRYVTWTYNDKGQAISSENIDGANKYQLEFLDNDRTRVTNPLGASTTYHFKNFLLKRKVVKVEGEAIGTCIATNASYSYDYKGSLISKTDKNGATTSYEYNDRGFQTAKKFSAQGLKYNIYTKWHDTLPLPVEVSHNGQKQTYQYDSDGRLVEFTDGFKDFSHIGQGYDVALLQFNDFMDAAGNVWTPVNNPQIVQDHDAIADNALYLDGNTYLTTDNDGIFDFGREDFTIEMWVNPERSGYSTILLDGMYRYGEGASFSTYINTNGYVYWQGYNHGSTEMSYFGTSKNIQDNQWHHIAYSRENGTLRIFVDGRLANYLIDKNNYVLDEKVIIAIGARASEQEYQYNYKGKIDQLRVTKKALYTTNFTPSREPYIFNGTPTE